MKRGFSFSSSQDASAAPWLRDGLGSGSRSAFRLKTLPRLTSELNHRVEMATSLCFSEFPILQTFKSSQRPSPLRLDTNSRAS